MEKVLWLKLFRRFLYAGFTGVILVTAFLLFSKWYIRYTTKKQIYTGIENIPYHKVALVLGTSRYVNHHQTNLYFDYRIDAACKLYFAKKVSYLLVSGDNRSAYYNEPRDMQHALMERGIPKEAIILDYAGIHTLDSVIRCKKVFGQNNCIIVSQEFHVARALFIANRAKMSCMGFTAKDVPLQYDYKTHIREYFACAKALMAMYVFHTQPKHLGKPVPIPEKTVEEKGGA
jgi:SanA protein